MMNLYLLATIGALIGVIATFLGISIGVIPAFVYPCLILFFIVYSVLFFIIVAFCLHIVRPGQYKVFTDARAGTYRLVHPGIHFFDPMTAFFAKVISNPWDGKGDWPLPGTRFEFDPPVVTVAARLNNGKGSASGEVDIRLVTRVNTALTEETVEAFVLSTTQSKGHKHHRRFVEAAANEFVRRVCHTMDFEACTVNTVYDHLTEKRADLDDKLQSLGLEVDRFVVEEVSFALDESKARADEDEYVLMRKRANKVLEADIAKSDLEQQRIAAQAANDRKIDEAEAEAKAQTLLTARKNKLEQERLLAMSQLIGPAAVANLMAVEKLGKMLSKGTHIVSPGAVGLGALRTALLATGEGDVDVGALNHHNDTSAGRDGGEVSSYVVA